MRLIDADEFEKRIKEYDTTDYADKALYNFAHNEMITMPTVDVLDKIRDAIEREADYQDAYVDADVAKGMYMAIEIMDKQTK